MRRFIEKSIIAALSLYASYKFQEGTDYVVFFLISLVISTSLDLITYKNLRYVIYIAFIALAFYNSTFLYYFPLIFYNLYLDFKYYSLISFLLLLIDFSPIIFIITSLSLYFSHTTDKVESIVSDYRMMRDNLKEDTLYLKKYNEQLTLDREKNIRIAILTERNRIAREIHDSIGHSISSSILQVKAIKIIADKKVEEPLDQLKAIKIIADKKVEEPLDQLQGTLSNGMNDIRKSLQGLRDESMDLKTRIENLIDEMPHMDIEFIYNIDEEIDYSLKFDILSIVKEAMTNTVKHSDATKMKISLIQQPKFYTLIITDNGKGKPSFNQKGIGLDYIGETANKYNGNFNYKYDNGFKIHVTLMKGN